MKSYSKKNLFLILFIFVVAFLLRIYGLNWDSNNHLHPDERFLTMVTNDIKLPTSFSQYFDTASSPLNPFNYSQYRFYVYGTFPIFLTKILVTIFNWDNYNQITIVGRILSALFDSGNVILLYFIASKFLKNKYQYFPSIIYALLVLPIQLSHFYAVDTFLNFFILLTFTLFSYNLFFPAFLAFGLAMSCKISAIYFAPIIFLFLLKLFLDTKDRTSFIPKIILSLIFSFIVFRIFQPYAFIGPFGINPVFVNNLKTLANYSNPNIYYPPGVQWINRLPLLNATKNTFIWGFGLPFSIPFLFLIFRYLFSKKIKIKLNSISIAIVWVLFLFVYQSIQYVHAMRYLLPIYPFLSLLFAALIAYFKVGKRLSITIFFLMSLYALAFLSIYAHPVSRVQASAWIINNIPSFKVLSSEYWDDALPVGYSNYKNISLAFFDPDTSEKWTKINNSLSEIDFMIMSSNRLWASIPRVPDKYPLASKFYENLFSEKTNFTFIKKFVSYPGFTLPFLKSCYYFGPSNYPGVKNYWYEKDNNCLYPGIYLRDDTAEEAFTVYDHPSVILFEKTTK